MTIKEIKTKRLTLIPVTGEILEYEINKLSLPNTLSGIIIPENWPHETVTKEVSEIFLSLFKEKRLFGFYWILNDSSGNKILIGSGGFIISENGDIELGYSVLKQFENNGYATEAVEKIIRKRNELNLKGKIFAKTEENNFASRRVLEKTGFEKRSIDGETSILIYSLEK